LSLFFEARLKPRSKASKIYFCDISARSFASRFYSSILGNFSYADILVTYASAYHGLFAINLVLIQFLMRALTEYGKTDNPQIAVWTKENPGAAWIQMLFHLIAIPGFTLVIATVCKLKIKIFKKLPVIGERLQNRQERSRECF
jgi:hypothetical protein